MSEFEFKDKPEDFIAATKAVQVFLQTSKASQSLAWLGPRGGGGHLHEALWFLFVQTRGPQWLQLAHRQRIEVALDLWKQLIDEAEAADWGGRFAHASYWLNEPSTMTPRHLMLDTQGMTIEEMDRCLNHSMLGQDNEKYLFRWLRILLRLPVNIDQREPKEGEYPYVHHPDRWKRKVGTKILKFNGCWRSDDPRRHELACRSTLMHFGLDPTWVHSVPTSEVGEERM